MKALIEIKNGLIHAHIQDQGLISEVNTPDDRIDSVSAVLAKMGPALIGYYLPHGGPFINRTVSLIDAQVLDSIKKSVRFMPEYNDLMLKIIKLMSSDIESAMHLVLCDSAYFTGLPDVSGTYALSYDFKKQGIKKYGRDGLLHLWAASEAQKQDWGDKKITVVLGENTNIAAIRGTSPVETSAGFTVIEGIPSCVSCGDIDPTIMFQLHQDGLSFNKINELFSHESGFSALVGQKITIAQMLSKRNDKKIAKAVDVYVYDILKSIGSFISVLGGISSIFFLLPDRGPYKQLLSEIIGGLDFLGVKCRIIKDKDRGLQRISTSASTTGVFVTDTPRIEVLFELMDALKERDMKNEK